MKKIYWIEYKKGTFIDRKLISNLQSIKLSDWDLSNPINWVRGSKIYLNQGYWTKQEWTQKVKNNETNGVYTFRRAPFFKIHKSWIGVI